MTLYLCFNAAGRCIYVGRTNDWDQRRNEHRRKSAWWPQVARVEVRLRGGRREAAEIQARRPEHNRQHNPDWRFVRDRFVPVMTSTRKLRQGRNAHDENLGRFADWARTLGGAA